MVLAGMLLVPQRIIHEERNPISRGLQKLYEPFFRGAIRLRWLVLPAAALFVLSVVWPLPRLGEESRPPLDEGDLLYMPTTDPSISIAKARQVLQQTDKLIRTFPEVKSVYGKMGRADSVRPILPWTLTTSGNVAISLSRCWRSCLLLVMLMLGSVVGMSSRSPSSSGGMNSVPSLLYG